MPASLLLLDLKTVARVEGDCSIFGYEGLITLTSISWGASAEPKAKESDIQSPVKLKQVRLSKVYDRASTSLCNWMNSGKAFEKATLYFLDPAEASINSDEKFPAIMQMVLTKGYIDSISIKASDSKFGTAISEDLQLSFCQIELTYFPVNAKSKKRVGGFPFTSTQPDPGTDDS